MLDDRLAHGPLTRRIALQAHFERGLEKEGHARHAISSSQVEQALPSRRGQGCRINHAQAIDVQALLNDEMEERESLRLKPLVLLVVTHERPTVV